MSLYLGSQPQHKTAAAVPRQIPRQMGQNGGGARKGHGDGRAQGDALAVFGRDGQGQKGVTARLGSPNAIKTDGLGRLCKSGHIA